MFDFWKKRKEKQQMKKQQKHLEGQLYNLYDQWTVQGEYLDAVTAMEYYKGHNDIKDRIKVKK